MPQTCLPAAETANRARLPQVHRMPATLPVLYLTLRRPVALAPPLAAKPFRPRSRSQTSRRANTHTINTNNILLYILAKIPANMARFSPTGRTRTPPQRQPLEGLLGRIGRPRSIYGQRHTKDTKRPGFCIQASNTTMYHLYPRRLIRASTIIRVITATLISRIATRIISTKESPLIRLLSPLLLLLPLLLNCQTPAIRHIVILRTPSPSRTPTCFRLHRFLPSVCPAVSPVAYPTTRHKTFIRTLIIWMQKCVHCLSFSPSPELTDNFFVSGLTI
jgi:hypothetical protein